MDGALRAVGRRGPHKTSVSDICQEAGVARGTFYRYFTGRDVVLEATGKHICAGVRGALQAAVQADPTPRHRLRVVVAGFQAYRDANPDIVALLDREPAFALRYLRAGFAELTEAVADALGPAVDTAPLVSSGAATRNELAEIFLRVVCSMLLFPGPSVDDVTEALEALWGVDTITALADVRPAS